MQLWEYKVVSTTLGDENSATLVLCEWGAQGWDLAGITSFGPSHWYHFKRPIPAAK